MESSSEGDPELHQPSDLGSFSIIEFLEEKAKNQDDLVVYRDWGSIQRCRTILYDRDRLE